MSSFYYHNKHDEAEGLAHHAYEYMGEAFDTTHDVLVVMYRPLYECEHAMFVRAKEDWEGSGALVEKNGRMIPRFTKIESPEIITALETIRNAMYPA